MCRGTRCGVIQGLVAAVSAGPGAPCHAKRPQGGQLSGAVNAQEPSAVIAFRAVAATVTGGSQLSARSTSPMSALLGCTRVVRSFH